jgi:hypothetical protein
MKVMSVVMTHGPRSRIVSQAVAAIKAFTIFSDVFIWNNGPYDLVVPEARVVNGVNDWGEVQKLTLPLILNEYDVFFYCDDDLIAHPLFLEHAVRMLGAHKDFLVCTGGSVIEGNDPLRRRWIPSASFPPKPFYADFADLGCFVILRQNVERMLRYRVMNSQPWGTDDLFFSASYWENGGVIYVPEQPTLSRRCVQMSSAHRTGLCSGPGFAEQRNKAIRELAVRGWRRKSQLIPATAPLFWS